jgi:glycine/D-amino acid oxidase-like deaminating enzyme
MRGQHRLDYIVVGLGLAGAAMALQLIKRGKRIAVFDDSASNRSSSVAAGLFNPITGKLMARTWKVDELFPYLINFYREAEVLTFSRFLFEKNIYIPFRSIQEQNDWTTRGEDAGMKPYVDRVFFSGAFGTMVSDQLGGVLVKNCGYLNVGVYLQSVRKLVESTGMFLGKMDYGKLQIQGDSVTYENTSADCLILCEGLHGKNNPLTPWLPVQPLKGETIDVKFSTELPAICNRGVYTVPMGENTYRVGATFERSNLPGPSVNGRTELETRLRSLVNLPYEFVKQDWGFRPTTRDRRPILGKHPQHDRVLILNGMGTKGVSQAPYFSGVLADYLLDKGQIGPEVNISRFYALSSESRD